MLGFWYLSQESLWSVGYHEEGDSDESSVLPADVEESNRLACRTCEDLEEQDRPPQSILSGWLHLYAEGLRPDYPDKWPSMTKILCAQTRSNLPVVTRPSL